MKLSIRLLTLLTFATWTTFNLKAQEDAPPPPEPTPAETAFNDLDQRIRAKLADGAQSPADFDAEATDFKSLLAEFAHVKTDDIARIAYMHAVFLAQIRGDMEAAIAAFTAVKADYPGSEAAAAAADILDQEKQEREAQDRLADLVGGPAPELDFTWSTDSAVTKLADLKGKVVVLDFWATWCGPCIRSFPMVKELTDHYADSAVAVVGVTSLQGKVHGLSATPISTEGEPDKEHALMTDFIAAQDINWTIAFSEQPVFNPEYGISGIPHMAIIAPDGTLRHNDLHPAMPHAEKQVLINAILKEFNLPVPSS
jgi:thiol-disulfide isomerase/thioredoxin